MKAFPLTVVTHEQFIRGVRDLAVSRLNGHPMAQRLMDAKMVYGVGARGARGVTYFSAWKNGHDHDFVEICALAEESDLQLAGTTIHELGHVMAGYQAGHGKEWKTACLTLGLTAEAAGQSYAVDAFEPTLWARIGALPTPNDGRPFFRAVPGLITPPATPRPCPMGIGTRGGKSRGTGSGSRLRLWTCQCAAPVKVRVASDDFQATCNRCQSAFTRAEGGKA